MQAIASPDNHLPYRSYKRTRGGQIRGCNGYNGEGVLPRGHVLYPHVIQTVRIVCTIIYSIGGLDLPCSRVSLKIRVPQTELKLGGCGLDSSIIRSELGGIAEVKTGSPLILMRGLNSFVLRESTNGRSFLDHIDS